MVACEKCWADSRAIARSRHEAQVDVYRELVAERDCTPEEQAGRGARACPKCDRETVHQVVGLCMACGYDPAKTSRLMTTELEQFRHVVERLYDQLAARAKAMKRPHEPGWYWIGHEGRWEPGRVRLGQYGSGTIEAHGKEWTVRDGSMWGSLEEVTLGPWCEGMPQDPPEKQP